MAESAFAFRVEDQLKSTFAQVAKAQDRTPAQRLRDFMRDYISHQNEAADYDRWSRAQVQIGIDSANAGRLIRHEEVEAEFAELRAQSPHKAGLPT